MRDFWCLVVAVALALLTAGCSDIEERCDIACKAARRCGVPHPVNDCTEYCVYHYENTTDKCQEEFDDLTECVGEEIENDDEDLCYGCENFYDDAYRACEWLAEPDDMQAALLGGVH